MVDIPDSRIPNTAEPRAAFLAALAGLDDDALKFMALALRYLGPAGYLGPVGHCTAAHAAAEAYIHAPAPSALWEHAGVSPDATLPLCIANGLEGPIPPRVP